MSSMRPRCAITGASGYVGTILTRALVAHGVEVVALNRAPSGEAPGVRAVPYTLGGDLPPGALSGVTVLIHCAYDFHARTRAQVWRANVAGTLRLFAQARATGVGRIVFISSMSAYEGCRSLYGQAKLAVEREGVAYGVISIRPGLIFDDGSPRGMVGAITGFLNVSPIVLLIGGGQQIQYPCHADDLAELVYMVCARPSAACGPIPAAAREGITFGEMLRRIARSKRKRAVFVPAPYHPIYWGMRAAEAMGVRSRLRSDSLLSLMSQNPHVDFAPLDALGMVFRGYPQAT